jgi:hypothetical protein
MCTVLLPPGVNPIEVNEYIIWEDIIKMGLEYILLTSLGWLTIRTKGEFFSKL